MFGVSSSIVFRCLFIAAVVWGVSLATTQSSTSFVASTGLGQVKTFQKQTRTRSTAPDLFRIFLTD